MLKKLLDNIQDKLSRTHLDSANLLRRQGKITEAVEQYQQVLKIYPKSVPAYYQLAQIAEGRSEFERASDYYQKILQLRPSFIKAQIGLANVLQRQGKIDEAEEIYQQVLAFQLQTNVVNRTTVTQKLIELKQAKTYLEIGVATGFNFLQIKAEKKIAVDPKFKIPGSYVSDRCHEYYQMTSDDFFATQSELLAQRGLDIVLVDGLHTYQQALKDVLNALKFLNEGGIIVMHDCYPISEAAGHPVQSEAEKMSGFAGAWMGDVWKTIVYLRSLCSHLNVFVLNCDCGVGIVKKGTPENKLSYSEEMIDRLTYEDFTKNRVEMLNLKDPNYFNQFLSQETT